MCSFIFKFIFPHTYTKDSILFTNYYYYTHTILILIINLDIILKPNLYAASTQHLCA